MENENYWLEKFIEVGLFERRSEIHIHQTELGVKYLEFVDKYSEPKRLGQCELPIADDG